jgi:hypothetical protein
MLLPLDSLLAVLDALLTTLGALLAALDARRRDRCRRRRLPLLEAARLLLGAFETPALLGRTLQGLARFSSGRELLLRSGEWLRSRLDARCKSSALVAPHLAPLFAALIT